MALLFFAKSVILPLAMAIMLAFVLNPIVMKLHVWGFSRVPAVITAVAITAVLVGALIWLVTLQLNALITDLPKYEDNVRSKLVSLRRAGEASALNRIRTKLREMSEDKGGRSNGSGAHAEAAGVPPNGPEDKGAFGGMLGPLQELSPALEALGQFLLALVLAIFILLRREDLRNRLLSFASGGSLSTTTKALDDAGHRISRYMVMQLIINGVFGTAIGLGLFFIGVPYALLWGLCAGILRYIPYIGPWIACAAPLAVSFVTSSHWSGMLLVLGLFLVLELITGNVLEPRLYGQGTGVSEVALLVCAAFWAWLWGPIGLMLATPLTVCVVVAGKYVPSMSLFDKLLGDRPVLKPFAVFLQRLLARDLIEAAAVVREYRLQKPQETVYDNLFVPALILARQDRANGSMQAEDGDYVLREMAVLVKAMGAVARPSAKLIQDEVNESDGHADSNDREGGGMRPISIVALPAHDEAEELTLAMLDQLMSPSGLHLEIGSTRKLPSETIVRVVKHRPRLIVIAALPPGGLPQASYLCERLREMLPEVGIIVGHWGFEANLDEVIASLRAAGANYVTTTLLGGRSHILSMLGDQPSSKPAVEPLFAERRPASPDD